MNAAYVDYDAEQLMRSKVRAESFVLAHTTSGDRIAIWTPPDRSTSALAAMQLWGKYNNVLADDALSRAQAKVLQRQRPSVLALYAPEASQIRALTASLPPEARPAAPRCTAVPYLGIGSPTAQVCVVRLRWIG